MDSLKAVLLFVFFNCVVCDSSEHDTLVKPCDVQDMECLGKSTEMFLEKTSGGIPKYDIKPIEPVFLSMVCIEGGKDLMFHYKNVTILGLKNMKIENFTLDPTAKSVVLSTKEDLNINADLIIEMTDQSKTFQGVWTAKGSTICTAKYNYDIKKDDKDVEHFEVGPETIHCEINEKPKVTISEDLQQTLENDPDARIKKEDYLTHQDEVRKTTVITMMEEAFASVVHNVRVAAKALPKSSFFTNV